MGQKPLNKLMTMKMWQTWQSSTRIWQTSTTQKDPLLQFCQCSDFRFRKSGRSNNSLSPTNWMKKPLDSFDHLSSCFRLYLIQTFIEINKLKGKSSLTEIQITKKRNPMTMRQLQRKQLWRILAQWVLREIRIGATKRWHLKANSQTMENWRNPT